MRLGMRREPPRGVVYMTFVKSSRSSWTIPGCVALAFVAAQLLIPSSAQASRALFRVKRSFFGVFSPFYQATEPSGKLPPATAYVSPMKNGSFVLPQCGKILTTVGGKGKCTGDPFVSYMYT